jgi:glycosyltransferase involved in cell wall biosynthesis
VAVLVSIVTPVLNGARFIRTTIESVLAQTYAPIEYVIADGGSHDGTLEIAGEYGERVRVLSGPDDGQGDAIRKGLAVTHGDFIAYLNADDTLLPGAIDTFVAELSTHPEAAMVYGDALHVDENGSTIARYPTRPFDAGALARECFIAQPATLLRRSAYDAAGGIDVLLQFAMDYDLWLRLAERYPVCYVPEVLATSRMYRANKTLRSRSALYREIFAVVRRRRGYVPYEWWAGYASQLLAPSSDQFFERPRATRLTAPLALWIGLGTNPDRPLTVVRDWRRHRGAWVRA